MRGPRWIESLLVGLMGGLIYGVFVYGINQWLGMPVSPVQTGVLALGFAGLSGAWLWIYYSLGGAHYGRAVIGLAAIILLSGPYIYCWVYGVLPYLGQPIHTPDMYFDLPQFIYRVLSTLALTGACTGLYFLPVMAHRHRKSRRRDMQVLGQLKERLEMKGGHRTLSTHFLRNMILAVGQYAADRRGPGSAKAVKSLIHLIEYVLANERETITHVDWRREWGQVRHLATVGVLTKGSQVIRMREPKGVIIGRVPALSWLTILENALLHGDYDAHRPIRIELGYASGVLAFHCSNDYTARSRRMQGTGQGLRELAKRGQMEVQDTGDRYELIFRTGMLNKMDMERGKSDGHEGPFDLYGCG